MTVSQLDGIFSEASSTARCVFRVREFLIIIIIKIIIIIIIITIITIIILIIKIEHFYIDYDFYIFLCILYF